MPDFQYVHWDASRYSDEEIKGKATLRVALLFMQLAHDRTVQVVSLKIVEKFTEAKMLINQAMLLLRQVFILPVSLVRNNLY